MNPSYVKRLEEGGMKFVGHDVDGERMEIIELEGELCYSVTDLLFPLLLAPVV